jgi:hypothetical protein
MHAFNTNDHYGLATLDWTSGPGFAYKHMSTYQGNPKRSLASKEKLHGSKKSSGPKKTKSIAKTGLLIFINEIFQKPKVPDESVASSCFEGAK